MMMLNEKKVFEIILNRVNSKLRPYTLQAIATKNILKKNFENIYI
jgi:hypothetical protein